MVTPEHPLVELLAIIDMVWQAPEDAVVSRGAPKWYSPQSMFKVYLVSLCKKPVARRGLWRYLKANPVIAAA